MLSPFLRSDLIEFGRLLLSPWALAVLGLFIGSFINVVIYRLPLMMERAWRVEQVEILRAGLSDGAVDGASGAVPLAATASTSLEPGPDISLSAPRSRCPACGHQISWYENVPVLSYLFLRGRCSVCSTAISLRYPLVEAFTAVLFAAIGWHFRVDPQVAQAAGSFQAVFWCGFAAVLLTAAAIDWDTTLLPDSLTFPLLWLGLLSSATGLIDVPLVESVWGAAAGYASLWSVYWLFKLVTGKEGMGRGDFKLLAALGAWLGVQMLIPVIVTSAAIGALVGIALKVNSRLRAGGYVPFGPFLAGAGLFVMFVGPSSVLDWMARATNSIF